jgi:hypothetical protein
MQGYQNYEFGVCHYRMIVLAVVLLATPSRQCLSSANQRLLLPLSCSGGLCARISYLCIDVTSSASIATLCL